MKSVISFITLGLVSCGIFGCETFTPPSRALLVKEDRTYVLDTNSNRRAAYVQQGVDGKWYLIAEPPPDTALQSTVKAAVELAAKTQSVDANGKGNLEVSQTIVKLVERTQAVTILRDSLYRLSEAAANGLVDKDKYQERFDKVLAAAELIAKADAEKAKADAEKAKGDAAEKLTKAAENIHKLDTDKATKDKLLERLVQ